MKIISFPFLISRLLQAIPVKINFGKAKAYKQWNSKKNIAVGRQSASRAVLSNSMTATFLEEHAQLERDQLKTIR